MKKNIFYPNCSELIADFNIKSPRIIYSLLVKLKEDYGWQFDPVLTFKMLENMKRDCSTCSILNKAGNWTSLNYGPNGYDEDLGFWLADSGNNHADDTQFPFFAAAVEDCEADMRCYDGGSMDVWEEWYNKSEIRMLIEKAKAKCKRKNTK